MNGIQKYLIAVALDAMHDAAGKLISHQQIDASTIAMSLNELVEGINTMEMNIKSKISCNVDYRGGFRKARTRLIDPDVNPIFVQPTSKS